MKKCTIDSIIILMILIAITIILTVAIGFPVHLFEIKKCQNYEEMTKIETKYLFCGGCYLKTKNGWMPMKEYQQKIIALDGLNNIK